jgi:hypothetical protein
MRTFIIHRPVNAALNENDLRQSVTEWNASILLGESFPGVIAWTSVKELIGDPNYAFSDSVAELLYNNGVLDRTPVMRDAHQQAKVKIGDTEQLVWDYTWGVKTFESLSPDNLNVVAWDLRLHQHFMHITVVDGDEPLDSTHTQGYSAPTEDDGSSAEADESPVP